MGRATFGAGCFWGVESFFRDVPVVTDAVAGYAGGHTQNPTCREVCSDRTGHAEVVQAAFDPQVISYDELFDVFFQDHGPAQLNRQGADVGTQYCSAIFFRLPEQERAARARKQAFAGSFRRPIVTGIDLPSCHVRMSEET